MAGKHNRGGGLPAPDTLLSRDDFQKFVFQRSGGRCVFCDQEAVDAHHILDRKLYADGGYYLGNGAAVCASHHWDCETTALSVKEVRNAAGITQPVLPSGFSPEVVYDKWGNRESMVYGSAMLVAGPLAQDDGMRKALRMGQKLQMLCQESDISGGSQ